MPRKNGYKHKYPYLGTMERISRLAAYRAYHIQETGKAPIWTTSCNRMGVDWRTVMIHAPEPTAKWYDVNFYSRHSQVP
jgi:hypothetical protein